MSRHHLASIAVALLAILVAVAAMWGGLVLAYHAPDRAIALMAVVIWAGLALGAAAAVWMRRPPWAGPFAAALVALVVWYVGLSPTNDADWAPEVARPLVADITGRRVVVKGVRAFRWRSDTDFTPRWTEQAYDLADIVSLDLVNSYWMGPLVAHTLLSFGFRDGRHLAFSVEIRPRLGQEFSSLAGFFRAYDLVFVAAEEEDILYLRTNIRREDVQLYQVNIRHDQIEAVFVDLLRRANIVATRPAFYNTLTRNCTTELFDAARDIIPSLPFDWRILVSGFVPDYAFDHHLLDPRFSMAELRRRAKVSGLGQTGGDGADYSTRIRRGLGGAIAPPVD